MKIAIISVTEKGKDLSLEIKHVLDLDSTIIKTDIYHKNVKENMKKLFKEYDAIIGIMASGILIRSICNIISSKTKDPAVLNLDENGKFVISLLSGHIGGANDLTLKISKLLDAIPVITTATDVNNKLGIDVLAKNLYFKVINPDQIVFINKAILNHENITLTMNNNYNHDFLKDYIKDNTLEIDLSYKYDENIPKEEIKVSYNGHDLFLKERKIVLGIGCKRGKSKEELLPGIKKALLELNIPISRLNYFSSAEIKNDEEGLLNLSDDLNIPIKFVSLNKLRQFKSKDISSSEFVKSKFGVGGVCEPSALIEAGEGSKLIYKKTPFNGVTIAIAISR